MNTVSNVLHAHANMLLMHILSISKQTHRHKFAVYWVIFIVKAMKVYWLLQYTQYFKRAGCLDCLNYDHIQLMQKLVKLSWLPNHHHRSRGAATFRMLHYFALNFFSHFKCCSWLNCSLSSLITICAHILTFMDFMDIKMSILTKVTIQLVQNTCRWDINLLLRIEATKQQERCLTCCWLCAKKYGLSLTN